jgi:hypothetical protein
MRSKYLSLVALVLAIGVLAVQSATLTNTFLHGNGTAYYGPVTFKPLSTPLLDDPDLIIGSRFIYRTTTNGFFTGDFKPGIYEMWTAAPDRHVYLDIPDNTNIYALSARITNAIAYVGSGIPSTLEWNATISAITNDFNDELLLKANVTSPIFNGVPVIAKMRIASSSAPAAPTDGFILFAETNVLKVIGVSNHITVIALP